MSDRTYEHIESTSSIAQPNDGVDTADRSGRGGRECRATDHGLSRGDLGESPEHVVDLLRRFRKHTLGKVGLGLLIALYGIALFADFLSPFDMTWTNKMKPYHPPTRISFIYNGPDGN